jgi:hypothetical protein
LSFIEGDLCIYNAGADRDGLPEIFEVRTVGGSMVRRANFDIALEVVKRHSGGSLGRWTVREPRPDSGVSRHDQHAMRQVVHPQVHRRPRI